MNTTTTQMCELIREAEPGDRLQIKFTYDFGGNFRETLLRLLAMTRSEDMTGGLTIGVDGQDMLIRARSNGGWSGIDEFVFFVGNNLDAEYFIQQFIDSGFIERIT